MFFIRNIRALCCAQALHFGLESELLYMELEMKKEGFKKSSTNYPNTKIIGPVLENECSSLLKNFLSIKDEFKNFNILILEEFIFIQYFYKKITNVFPRTSSTI